MSFLSPTFICDGESEVQVSIQMCRKLQKTGFSECRSRNALAATGYVHPGKAGKWLVSHVDDVDLDTDMTREFYVFLCPLGNIVPAVLEFWQACRRLIGWNAAMEYPPHITLLPPFEVPSSKVPTVHMILASLTSRFLSRSLPDKLPLKAYQNSDPNFIGYVVHTSSKTILEEYTDEAIAELEKGGIYFPIETLNKRKGIYHLSLAYGFLTSTCNELNTLMERILPASVVDGHCEWEIRIYSRDGRLCNSKDIELYQMNSSVERVLTCENESQLCYAMGDYVALMGVSDNLRHGWARGVNLDTGIMGEFMPIQGQRVPQSDAWILHRTWSFRNISAANSSHANLDIGESTSNFNRSASLDQGTAAVLSKNISSDNSNKVKRSSSMKSSPTEKKPRRLLVMRHGERMDMCFSRAWITKCFDSKGVYKRANLNMPLTLPQGRPHMDFQNDSPLTQIGHLVAFVTGQGLALAGFTVDYCYCSPALRCVQTAAEVLKGCSQPLTPIRVEPLLFEWLGWYGNRLPPFMTPANLRRAGYNVDVNYKPLSSSKEYNMSETIEKYCDRTAKLVKKVMENHKRKGVCILIVGHAGSLDTCTRPFVESSGTSFSLSSSWNRGNIGSRFRNGGDSSTAASSMHATTSYAEEFCQRASRVPYCGVAMAEESRGGKWQLVQPPVPPLTHSSNPEFDWRTLVW